MRMHINLHSYRNRSISAILYSCRQNLLVVSRVKTSRARASLRHRVSSNSFTISKSLKQSSHFSTFTLSTPHYLF